MGYEKGENPSQDDGPATKRPSMQSEGEQGKPQPLSRKLKLLTAGSILFTNVSFGCGYNTYGPVLTTMQNKYGTDDSTISKALTILTGCYMVGALSGGFIYNYVNRQLAVITILGTMGTIMMLTPHCPNMTLFFLTAGVMGLCCGSYDTAQFVWMMEMLQKECPPYVQGQHFTYALGTILASLIMAPFLDEKKEDVTTTTVASAFNSSISNDIFAEETSTKAGDTKSNKLFIPYTIIGCLNLLAMSYHLMLFIFMRYRPPPPEISEDDNTLDLEVKVQPLDPEKQEPTGLISRLRLTWTWPKLRIVFLCCCFYGAYNGMEMSTFQFFPKFGQNSDLDLSESDSTYVLTGMNIGFAVGRGIAIVAVFKIMPQLLLCGNIAIVLAANILLIGWASHSLTILWVCSVMFGLGISSMFGAFSAYIERYLNFTNAIGSLMIVCGSGMASIYPLVIGDFIEHNPVVLSYTAFFSISLIIFAVSTSSYLTYKNKTRY